MSNFASGFPFYRKNVIKYVTFGFMFSLALICISLWIISGQLVSPGRQAVQDYQKDWIQHPSSHGIHVSSSQCDKGRVPCLFVSPNGASGAGERGKIMRRQLEDDGLSLKPYGSTQGILILLHGRHGRKEMLLPVAERFDAIGFNCVIPDLPSHGESPINQVLFATTRFEQGIAVNVLADARAFFNDQTSPAVIWGLSMGGAYAVDTVSRSPSLWKAMVVVSSFDSLDGVIEDQLTFLPRLFSNPARRILSAMINFRGGLVLENVQPVVWANKITAPTLIVHGERDALIAIERGKRLFEAIQSKNKLWLKVPGADHNTILVTDMPVYAKMGEWFIASLRK
jgi:alpha-beta hydrolase superfamily lysophospholipase